MADLYPGGVGERTAAEALTSGYVVYFTSATSDVYILDAGANQAAAQQLHPAGIIDRDYLSGDKGVSIIRRGIVKAIAGDAISIGDRVVVEYGTGKVIGGSLTLVDGDYVLGIALTAASADGDEIVIDLNIECVTVYAP